MLKRIPLLTKKCVHDYYWSWRYPLNEKGSIEITHEEIMKGGRPIYLARKEVF